jgi:hypothetical protein
MRLFVGDDWSEDHHDVELMDATGRVLARKRLPEGVAGMARLHELIGLQLGEDAEDAEVVIGIETDHGPWAAALVAAGYVVFAVNPLQASRYRERHGVSGAFPSGGPPQTCISPQIRVGVFNGRGSADSIGKVFIDGVFSANGGLATTQQLLAVACGLQRTVAQRSQDRRRCP